MNRMTARLAAGGFLQETDLSVHRKKLSKAW